MQNKVLPIALDSVSSALGTDVKAKGIDIDFFEEVTLNDVFIAGADGDTLISAESLNIDISMFSFFGKTLFIDDIRLSGARVILNSTDEESNYQHILDHLSENPSSLDSNPTEEGQAWKLGLDDVYLDDVKIYQTSETSTMQILIPSLSADFKEFPEVFDTITFDEVISQGISVTIIEHTESVSDSKGAGIPKLPITIQIDKIETTETEIRYEKSYKPRLEKRFDANHIHLTGMVMNAVNVEWGSSISGTINTMELKNQDEWELSDFKTQLFASEEKFSLDGLELRTADSQIAGSLNATYSSLDKLIQDLSNQNVELDLLPSVISKKDIVYFLGSDELSFIDVDYLEDITYSGNLRSSNGNLSLQKNDLKIGNKLALKGDAKFDLENDAKYSVNIDRINTSQQYLTDLLPLITIPKEIKDLGDIAGGISINGDSDQVNISKIDLSLHSNTIIKGRGAISHLDRAPYLWLDFEFDSLYLNPNDIFQGESIPSQIYNMGQIDYKGSYVGNTTDMILKGQLVTDIGDADIDAALAFESDYTGGEYKGKFELEEFDLGTLLQDTTLGIVTASGSIDGSGFDPNNLEATVDLKSEMFDYNGERYEDIVINGKYGENIFEGRVTSRDDKLKLDFDGVANINGEASQLEFSSTIDKLDLTQFGIGDSIFWMSGVIRGDFNGNDIDNVNGIGTIEHLKIGTSNGIYETDSIVKINAYNSEDGEKIYNVESPFLDGEVNGNIKLSQLPKIIEAYIKNYIPIANGYEESVAIDTAVFDHQKFAVDLRAKDLNPLLSVLIDEELKLKDGYLKGNFNSDDSKIDFKGSIDSLMVKGYIIEHGAYFFDGRQDFINGNIILDNISDGKETLIQEANINTSFNDKIATLTAELFDERDEQTLLVGADISRTEDYVLNFHNTIIINQSVWEFSPFNEITYGSDGLYMQDVSVAKGRQAITVYTDDNDNGQAIEILTDNFILSELTSIIGKENEYFEGEINGSIIVNNIWGKPFVTADVEMKEIMLQEYAVGVAKVESIQDTKTNTVITKVILKGEENDAKLNLVYGIKDRSVKGVLDLKRLEVKTIDPFLTDILVDSEGALVGKIKIEGTPTEPLINGELDLVNVQTTPVFTNSRYAILDQTIAIDEESISFGNMVVVDKNNNIANISGQILHTNLSEFYLDLNIDTEKFLFLNTTSIENELFYGNVTIEGDVSIVGPLEDIKIDGTAKAIDNSKLSLSPFSVEELDYETDFIIYADPRKISLDSLNSKTKGVLDTYPFDVDLKLSIEEDSEFEMIMNPITGDNITGRGNADLIFNLKKSGEMDLFGTYEVTSGKYLFTFGVVTKEFDIQQGGTVVFSGDPLQGVLDVEAIYEASTSVYDLLILDASKDFDNSEIAETKRRRPVNVILSLSNSILQPEIAMDIRQTEQSISSNTEIYELVDDKLELLRTDPNELNKQVFGLLILDNFIVSSTSDPNFAQTGANIAFSSLSSLVTSQLNSLAEGLVKGVDVNFDVNSYSSDFISSGDAGLVTELGVGVSKQLFNNRLTLSAGTNVDLESSTSSALFNNLAGDFIIAYQLTEDGKVNIKVFRKSNYTTIGDENASKNGVGVTYRKEFGTVKKKAKN